MISPRWNSLKRAFSARKGLDLSRIHNIPRKRTVFSLSTVDVGPEDELDVESFESLFGYTWLTHLKLLEEDSAFRQQVLELRMSRRLGRSNYLKNLVDNDRIDSQLPYASQCPSLTKNLDEDLEWISAQNELMNDEKVTKSEDGFKVLLGGQELKISPLWISVHVDEKTRKSAIFESVVPIEQQVVDKLDSQLTPFYESWDLMFEEQAEFVSGPWRNYFVGIVGEVSVLEDGNLWPNQILHKDRCLYNVRNASDLVKFLADPTKEDVETHLENLQRLAQERNYKRGWCWHMLKTRWGEQALAKYGISDISY